MSRLAPEHAYRLAGDFTDSTEKSVSSLRGTFEPGEAKREKLILEKLGVHGWGRLQYFRLCFSGGWGEAVQQPLSPRSQEMFFKALEQIRFPENAKPSLFLTDEGFLELAWQDAHDHPVQIEFGSKEFEIYIETSGLDQTYSYAEMNDVLLKHFFS